MKKTNILLLLLSAAILLFAAGCDEDDKDLPKDQGGKGNEITNLFGITGLNVTVSGKKLTNAEWGSGATGVVGMIETALYAGYEYWVSLGDDGGGIVLDYKTAFGEGVTIIVEKPPLGYNIWRVLDGNNKTLYLNYDGLMENNALSTEEITNAILCLKDGFAYQVQAAPARDTVRLAKAPKYDNLLIPPLRTLRPYIPKECYASARNLLFVFVIG